MKVGRVARCDQCIRNLRQSRPGGLKRKRNSSGISRNKRKRENYEDSTDSEDYDVAAAGVMKVFAPHLSQGLSRQRDVLKCIKARYHLLWRRPSPDVPRPPHKTRPQPCRPRPHNRHFPQSCPSFRNPRFLTPKYPTTLHIPRSMQPRFLACLQKLTTMR